MSKNGAEKLFSRMTDREYAELADLPEELIYEDVLPSEECEVDETKDEFYYSNRIAKGYGLTDNALHR